MNRPEQPSESAAAHYRLASVWQLKGHLDRAIDAYRRALECDPGYVSACLELAALLAKQGTKSEAVEWCEKTLAAKPNSVLLHNRLQELTSSAGGAAASAVSHPDEILPEFVPGDAARQRILFYTDCPGADGAEQAAQRIMLDLNRAGFEVVCAQEPASNHLVDERDCAGIGHVWLAPDNLYDPDQVAKSLEDGTEATRILDRVEPSLVFFSDGSPMSSLAAKIETISRGVPCVIHNHCVNPEWADQFGPYLGNLENVFNHANEVVAVSSDNLRLLRERFRLPLEKGRVIFNGCSEAFFAPRKAGAGSRLRRELQIPADAVVCLTVARMEVMKGYQYQLRAIERLMKRSVWKKLCFVWVGTGTLETRFKSIAADMGADDRIRFLGHRDDVRELLGMADLFLLPSQYEGMPMSIIEAMAMGLPVAASAVSGIPEALDGTGELLTDPRLNEEACIKKMVSVIERWSDNPAERAEAGNRCQNRARAKFRESAMVGEFRRLIVPALEASER